MGSREGMPKCNEVRVQDTVKRSRCELPLAAVILRPITHLFNDETKILSSALSNLQFRRTRELNFLYINLVPVLWL